MGWFPCFGSPCKEKEIKGEVKGGGDFKKEAPATRHAARVSSGN